MYIPVCFPAHQITSIKKSVLKGMNFVPNRPFIGEPLSRREVNNLHEFCPNRPFIGEPLSRREVNNLHRIASLKVYNYMSMNYMQKTP